MVKNNKLSALEGKSVAKKVGHVCGHWRNPYVIDLILGGLQTAHLVARRGALDASVLYQEITNRF